LKKIENFDPKFHCVIAIDIKQIYSSVNVVRCVSILEKICSDS
jgi:hypothetical protein